MEYKHNPHMNIIAEKKDMNLRPKSILRKVKARFQKDRVYVSCHNCKYDTSEYAIFRPVGSIRTSVKGGKVFDKINTHSHDIIVCPDCVCDMFGVEV